MVETAPISHSRLRVVDGLRLLAALSVVLYHYTGARSHSWVGGSEGAFPVLQPITIYGSLGVELFFMISGFVILMSAWGRTVPQFVASRVSRLYPAYWLGVIASGAVLFFTGLELAGSQWSSIGFDGLLYNLTMLQTAFVMPHVDGVYWTLFVELKFYALLGLLLLVGITRTRILILCTAWPALGALALASGSPHLLALVDPQYAPFFAMGMLVYLLWRDGLAPVPIALLAANWIYSLLLSFRFADAIGGAGAGTALPIVVMAVFTVFLLALIVATLTPVATIDWGWLTVAGAITYPLYLLHDVIGAWLITLAPAAWPPAVTLLLVVAAMGVAAYGVHRFVERPLGPRLRRGVERALAWRPSPSRPDRRAEFAQGGE